MVMLSNAFFNNDLCEPGEFEKSLYRARDQLITTIYILNSSHFLNLNGIIERQTLSFRTFGVRDVHCLRPEESKFKRVIVFSWLPQRYLNSWEV